MVSTERIMADLSFGGRKFVLNTALQNPVGVPYPRNPKTLPKSSGKKGERIPQYTVAAKFSTKFIKIL